MSLTVNSDMLSIHYYYPPVRSGGVLRNYYFNQYFATYFNTVHVISSDNYKSREQEDLPLKDNISPHYVGTLDYRSFKRTNKHISTAKKSSFLFQFITKLQKTLPFHFLLGEGSIFYIFNAYKRAKRIIQANPVEVIYSSFMPYADHLVAFLLKKKYPSITWIADFRDLQVEPLYKNLYFPKWNQRIEKYILKRADILTTVSNGLAQHLEKYNKVFTIPRGINKREFSKQKSDVFTIVYTGNLIGNFRDGELFVKALKTVIKDTQQKLQFIHAGRDGSIWKNWFEKHGILENFVDKGYISRKESLSLQEQADILLLLTSSTSDYQGVFTGKLFEYLETGNPILNIINGVKDQEFEALFSELNAGIICYSSDVEKASQFILKVLQNNTHEINSVVIESKYSWDAQVRKILNYINYQFANEI